MSRCVLHKVNFKYVKYDKPYLYANRCSSRFRGGKTDLCPKLVMLMLSGQGQWFSTQNRRSHLLGGLHQDLLGELTVPPQAPNPLAGLWRALGEVCHEGKRKRRGGKDEGQLVEKEVMGGKGMHGMEREAQKWSAGHTCNFLPSHP